MQTFKRQRGARQPIADDECEPCLTAEASVCPAGFPEEQGLRKGELTDGLPHGHPPFLGPASSPVEWHPDPLRAGPSKVQGGQNLVEPCGSSHGEGTQKLDVIVAAFLMGSRPKHLPRETTATLSGKKCSLYLMRRCTSMMQIAAGGKKTPLKKVQLRIIRAKFKAVVVSGAVREMHRWKGPKGFQL